MSLSIFEDEKRVNHRKKREWRQIQILKDIAINGPQSITSLVIIQGVKYRNDITSPWDVLKDLKFLEYDHEVKGAGSPQRFYRLSKLGMEFLSKEQSLKPEEFWRIAFQVYEKQVFKTKLPLEIFFSNYEKHVLGFDFEFTPVKVNRPLKTFGLIHVTKDPNLGVYMMIILSMNNPMTGDSLVKYLKDKNPLNIKIDDSKIDVYFQGLIQNNLIVELTNEKDPKYRITILGFMHVMKFLAETPKFLGDDSDTHNLTIKKIIENSQVKIPFLSKFWPALRQVVDEPSIPELFNGIIRESNTFSRTIHTDGVKELLIIERMMEDAFGETILDEAKIGLDVMQELELGDSSEKGFFSPVRKRLLFLLIISDFRLQDQEKIIESVKGSKFFLAEHAEKVISNKIAFEFFIYFIDRVIDSKKKGDKNSLSKVQKWNEFQKSNEKFREWFDNWIEQLAEFEERNVEVLKERPFLKV